MTALRALTRYFELVAGSALTPGVIAAIQTFGDRINFHPHLHFLVTEGGTDRTGAFHLVARIDDSRLEEIFANAHRGKVRKARLAAFPLRIVEEELRRVPSKGWAAMIRKVYEVDPLTCPRCGGAMKVVAFLTEHDVVDKIIEHLKLTFVAAKPPPSQVAFRNSL